MDFRLFFTRGRLLRVLTSISLLVLVAVAVTQRVQANVINDSPKQAASSVVQTYVLGAQPSLLSESDWETKFSQSLDIHLLQKLDSSGPDAWDSKSHKVVFVTSEGPGYGGYMAKVKTPGLVIIDAYTDEVVTSQHYDLGYEEYFETHGLGVSPDGKWIYVPTGDVKKRAEGDAGRILIINAKTLKLDMVLSTKSMPHHFKSYTSPEGKGLVMGEDFNWQAPSFGLRPGSGVYVLDPSDNNRIVGGVNADTLQANPYLAFASPKGDFFYIGLPPGPINDPDLKHKLDGTWAVVDTKTWEAVKYYMGGYDPIWTAFSSDGKFAYLCDGGSDEVFKVDTEAKKVIATSRTAVHGAYGCHLGWDETKLWVIEKGEASHNRGKNIGLVDAKLMVPLDNFNTAWLRADHGTLMPDPERNELWVTSNSTYEVVVWDMTNNKIKTRIATPNGGSTHSGAFVWYKDDGTAEVLVDQNGTHGTARELQLKYATSESGKAPEGLVVPFR